MESREPMYIDGQTGETRWAGLGMALKKHHPSEEARSATTTGTSMSIGPCRGVLGQSQRGFVEFHGH
jgi:hypothetical protein